MSPTHPPKAIPSPAPPEPSKGAWAFILRWQEHLGWQLLYVALAVVFFIVLGALDRDASKDTLPMLAALPIKAAYALVACGVMFQARKRWRRKLSAEEANALWTELMAGKPGAYAAYFGDLVFSLVALIFLLRFFQLPS